MPRIFLADDDPRQRDTLVRMIEEYARLNDHADLPRQRIAGRVGQ